MIEWETEYITAIRVNIEQIMTNDFGLNTYNIAPAIYRTFSDRMMYHNALGDTIIFHEQSVTDNDPMNYARNDIITLIDRAAVIINSESSYIAPNGVNSGSTTIKRTVSRTNEKNNTDTGTVTADNSTTEASENSPIDYGPQFEIAYPNEKGKSQSNSTTERNLSSINTESGSETLNDTHSYNNISAHDVLEALKFIAKHGNIMISIIYEIVDKYYIEHLTVF